jgi:hypothetical protein
VCVSDRPSWSKPRITGIAPSARAKHTAIPFKYREPNQPEPIAPNAILVFGGSADPEDTFLLNDMHVFLPSMCHTH